MSYYPVSFMQKYISNGEEKVLCMCDFTELLRNGCKCGAIEREKEDEERKREEKRKKDNELLEQGISYEERRRILGDL